MQKTKRVAALSSLMALLIYLGPNLVQDIHRVFGHHHHHSASHAATGINHTHGERCDVCTFEFNIVDEPQSSGMDSFSFSVSFSMPVQIHQQFENNCFKYYQLRAPPLA